MSRTDEVCRSYLDLRWHFDPAAASQAGLTQFDGRLGHYDDDSVGEHLAAFRALEAAAEELDVETTAEEIERTALLDEIRATLERLQHERPHRRNPAYWLLHLAEALDAIRTPADAEAAVMALARLQAIPLFLQTALRCLAAPADPLAAMARALTGPVHDLIGEVEGALLGEPSLATAAAETAREARAELSRFGDALDAELDGDPTRRAGVGEDHFDRLLHHLHAVSTGSAEAWRYLLRREAELEEELRALGEEAGGDWRDLLAGLRLAQGVPGDLAADAVRELDRLGRWVADHDLFPPSAAAPEVHPLPAHLEVVTGFGVYRSRGWRASGGPRIELSAWSSTAAALCPVLAELGVPGLHLHDERMESLGPEVRRHLEGRLTHGGWGLYALHTLLEAGCWTEPVERLSALAQIYFRHLLARVDVGLHTHQLSVAESVAFLVERLGLEPEHALAAVRGCLLEPTEAVGTILGLRELVRLRDDAAARAGAGFSLRGFHEEVLAYGALPTPLIRWGMGFED